MLKATILDGYIDEPTCLGVPPYISPYPRYIAGAIWSHFKRSRISYLTIDQIRNDASLLKILFNSDLLIVIAGMSVPGRYLSGFPISPYEILSNFNNLPKPIKVLAGPAARYGFGMSGGKQIIDIKVVQHIFDIIADGDAEIVIADLLSNNLKTNDTNTSLCRKNPTAIKNFAVYGSNIVKQHPFYPDYLIAEIETYRGCSRSIVGGCSFCSEQSKGSPKFREIKDILDEINALYNNGIRHFRIGNQPCIFSYMAKDADKNEFPKPNPEAIEKLFKGIRMIAPNLKTLHIDNANPGIIARFKKESTQIAKSIIKYHTSGDVAAFGVESTDPIVIKKNNLKASPKEAITAIQLLNEIGSKRGINGLPELLPGLNFVFGLLGETKKTFIYNYNFLKELIDKKLLIRRINLRQVIPIPGTKIYSLGSTKARKNKREFHIFKRNVKKNIERPMLKKIVSPGTLLKDIYTEIYKGNVTFGRQLGSYPLLIGIPGVFPLHSFINVKVVDYGYRSITAIPFPLDINRALQITLEAIPGVGKKRATRILSNRPYTNKDTLIKTLDNEDIGRELLKYVNI
jgi:radical SAM superfamily enzyme with C-terminal helix-hairpin-helix motif